MATVKDPQDTRPVGEDADEEISVRVFIHREDDHWSAIAIDYTIVGQGETHEAAIERLRELIISYFESCARDGISIAHARRPISRRWEFELRIRGVTGRLRHLVAHRASAPRIERVILPRGGACLT